MIFVKCFDNQDMQISMLECTSIQKHKEKRIKPISWEYSCDDKYMEEFKKGKILKYSSFLAVLQGNRLDSEKK